MNKNKVIIIFNNYKNNTSVDLEIPVDITSNDLISSLNEAYKLGIDTDDIKKCYLNMENPIALLRGDKELHQYGIRNGSIINYIPIRLCIGE